MSLHNGYGVLKCHAVAGEKELGKDTPHYQVHVKDDQFSYRLAINVRSSQKPFDLLYFIDDNFQHFITDKLDKLNFGLTKIESSDRKAGGTALDYIRANLFKVNQMKPLPFNVPGANNDLNELIDSLIQRAIETQAVVYAFGEPWKDQEGKADRVFPEINPSRGVHNIHMNQGNSGKFAGENGVFQDGGLLIHYPSASGSQDHWVAAFFAFQSQSFHTDDRTGNPIDKRVGTEPISSSVPSVKARVRIVAALVNPRGEDTGKESVTLMNSSPEKVDLSGWAIADKLKHKQSLDGLSIEPGQAIAVPLSGENVQLSNDGGIISLLDSQDIKVDGVSYTKESAIEQGWTIVF